MHICTIKQDEQTVATHAYVLTFTKKLQLPKIVNVGYHQVVRVEKIKPPPLQCRHCLKYGHSEQNPDTNYELPTCPCCGDSRLLNDCQQELITATNYFLLNIY